MPGRTLLRRLYFQLHWLLGDGARLVKNIRRHGWVVSLNLHRVSPESNDFYPPLPPQHFEQLVAFLKEHFQVTTYDLLGQLEDGKTPLVLSFDDGYHDFLEYAVPILRKFGLRANQNVVCECIVSGKPIWNVQLYDFLNQAPEKLLAELRVPGWQAASLSSSSKRTQLGLSLSRLLKNVSRKERLLQWREIETLMARCDGLRFTRVMSSEEVTSIASEHQVGVHSFDHDSMGFENDDFFPRDVLRCRDFFREHLKLPLKTYAFPNGSYRPEQIEHLLSSGFEHVLLVDEQFGRLSAAAQPRFTFYGDSTAELRLRSLGYFAKGVRCES